MTTALEDRLVYAPLPGSAWLVVFLNHFAWAMDPETELGPDERLHVARQLIVLHEAAVQGASAALDTEVTEHREMLDEALRILGYVPDPADAALTKHVFRADDLKSLLAKLRATAVMPTGEANGQRT